MARVAVRNGVRGIAERVLGHPGLHRALGHTSGSPLLDEDRRREVNVAIADEVMKRGAPGASQLTAVALIVAGRRAVEALQSGRPVSEENHTPPQALVTYALAAEGMAPRVREAVERHLEHCAACRDDVRILGNILRNQEAVADHVDKERVSAEFNREAREAAPDVGPDLAARLREAQEAASAEVANEVIERLRAAPSTRSKDKAKKKAAPARPRVHRDRDQRDGRGPMTVALPLVAVAGVVAAVWWFTGGKEAAVQASAAEIAAVAIRETPNLRSTEGLPESAVEAVNALKIDDCITAAGHLRSARRADPADGRLYYLEAASWVCAGKGDRALDALESLEALGEAVPRGFYWVRAQAWLLDGQPVPAFEDLSRVQLEDARHREQAAAQVRQLQAMKR